MMLPRNRILISQEGQAFVKKHASASAYLLWGVLLRGCMKLGNAFYGVRLRVHTFF